MTPIAPDETWKRRRRCSFASWTSARRVRSTVDRRVIRWGGDFERETAVGGPGYRGERVRSISSRRWPASRPQVELVAHSHSLRTSANVRECYVPLLPLRCALSRQGTQPHRKAGSLAQQRLCLSEAREQYLATRRVSCAAATVKQD